MAHTDDNNTMRLAHLVGLFGQVYSAAGDSSGVHSCRLCAGAGTSMSRPIAAGAAAMVSARSNEMGVVWCVHGSSGALGVYLFLPFACSMRFGVGYILTKALAKLWQ